MAYKNCSAMIMPQATSVHCHYLNLVVETFGFSMHLDFTEIKKKRTFLKSSSSWIAKVHACFGFKKRLREVVVFLNNNK
jgi:hypothetical protein